MIWPSGIVIIYYTYFLLFYYHCSYNLRWVFVSSKNVLYLLRSCSRIFILLAPAVTSLIFSHSSTTKGLICRSIFGHQTHYLILQLPRGWFESIRKTCISLWTICQHKSYQCLIHTNIYLSYNIVSAIWSDLLNQYNKYFFPIYLYSNEFKSSISARFPFLTISMSTE